MARISADPASPPQRSGQCIPLADAFFWYDREERLVRAKWRGGFQFFQHPAALVGLRLRDYAHDDLQRIGDRAAWAVRRWGGLVGPLPYRVPLPSGLWIVRHLWARPCGSGTLFMAQTIRAVQDSAEVILPLLLLLDTVPGL